MPRTRLHLDADTSKKGLQRALLQRGHDVTRTPCSWMRLDATDEEQLLGATAQERCTVTFNVSDFIALSQRYPRHGGIIVAKQNKWPLNEMIAALDELIRTTDASDWVGQVRWLSDWRRKE